MEAIVLWSLGWAALAVIGSFRNVGDAASPQGDGMILGLLLLAVPLWPITMPLWALYVFARHRNATGM